MKFLLDTNVCIALMRGHRVAIARMEELGLGSVAVSAITTFELFTGVAKCRLPEQERAKVEGLLARLSVLPSDDAAAKRAAIIRSDLESTGTSCGPYDLLLAGHALARGLILATNNSREFSRVKGLKWEDWLKG